jgi:putative NIF3 family GTP cyclohydrolase 1 type 2
MHIRTVLEELEKIAPPDLADEDDTGRIGLVVEGEDDIRSVCCSVDVTPRVVQQAIWSHTILRSGTPCAS